MSLKGNCQGSNDARRLQLPSSSPTPPPSQDPNTRLEIHYSDSLAHLAIGGAHILLCPLSRDPPGMYPVS